MQYRRTPHGKSYSALILTLPISVSDEIARTLQQQGRVPLSEDGVRVAAMPAQVGAADREDQPVSRKK